MRFFDRDWTLEGISKWLMRQASFGCYKGENSDRDEDYVKSCTAAHSLSGSIAILTRDTGAHLIAAEQPCLHLSLSFRVPDTGQHRPKDEGLTREWITTVFGSVKNLVWVESPQTSEGMKDDTWHYRLFFTPGWIYPVLPQIKLPEHWFRYQG